MKKIISIIALIFVLVGFAEAQPRKTLDVNICVRHLRYLQKVPDRQHLDLFNHFYVKKVEPQLRMARTKPSYIETVDLAEIMEYYDVDTGKPFYISYTAYGYVYTYFGMLTSDTMLYGFFYKEAL